MTFDLVQAEHVYIACGFSDMRKSRDGFAMIVQHTFELDPFSSSLFVFCGRRSDRIKALYWDGDGFLLLYKRLERGRFRWPRGASEAKQISRQQLRWLGEGLSIEQKGSLERVEGLSIK
jgi:transposase